ncbi:MAG: hypothetical protein Q9222_007104 [Ikaeria aurantiellina]
MGQKQIGRMFISDEMVERHNSPRGYGGNFGQARYGGGPMTPAAAGFPGGRYGDPNHPTFGGPGNVQAPAYGGRGRGYRNTPMLIMGGGPVEGADEGAEVDMLGTEVFMVEGAEEGAEEDMLAMEVFMGAMVVGMALDTMVAQAEADIMVDIP